jgi:hypothetical protein
MLAYCLLAAVAAVITSAGLRAEAPQVVHSASTTSPVSSAAPARVSGGLLRARPTVGTSALERFMWVSASSAEHSVTTVVVAAPTATAGSDGDPTAAPTGTTVVAGSAKDSGQTSHSTSGSSTTIAARPTTDGTAKGHGKGHGPGAGDDSGKGKSNPGKGRGR